MLVQCTKKLLDEIKITPVLPEEEYNPLFSWHANLLMLNRKKTIILVNDKNRYLIVLHGLRAKDLKNLNKLIVDAIRENLSLECVKQDVIERFVPIDTEIQYSKTQNKSAVARLNKSCEVVQYLARQFNTDSLNQTVVGMNASRYLVGVGNVQYANPHKEMFKGLEELTGTSVFKCKAVQIKVTLGLVNFEVWRRLVIPINYTFKQLHDVLQNAFNWKDYHLHDFYVNDGRNAVMNLVCGEDAFDYPADVPMKMETDSRLYDFFPDYKEIIYTYDFGDNWKHYLELESVIPDYSYNYSKCLEGLGNTPPEDVGSETGYESFLEAISDPAHGEYEFNVEWGKMQGYSEFNIDEVNRRLELLADHLY